jgi:hypothetical protein
MTFELSAAPAGLPNGGFLDAAHRRASIQLDIAMPQRKGVLHAASALRLSQRSASAEAELLAAGEPHLDHLFADGQRNFCFQNDD